MKICHITSVHTRNDVRIYEKEINSLRDCGYDVILIVADGKKNDSGKGIIDVGTSSNRFSRMTKTVKKLRTTAMIEDADVYHIHDPELIRLGAYLKRKGKIVIFDSHEDVPKQILSKPYLNKMILNIISKLYKIYEKALCRNFDLIITATPAIKEKFLKINKHTEVINNYPMKSDANKRTDWISKKDWVCYIGGISKIRGISELVGSMALTDNVKLVLAGTFNEQQLFNKCISDPGWQKVDYMGQVNNDQKKEIYSSSKAGLVTFLNYPNHIDAQPNKMFEYMNEGLPVIASHFPLWKEIIEENHCGICIDPTDPKEISQATEFIINNPHEAENMGKNGQRAVQEKYNWEKEENKLIELYQNLEKKC